MRLLGNVRADEIAALTQHYLLLRLELLNLVRLLEPLERDGGLDVPGLATLDGARAALRLAKRGEETT